MRNKALIKNVVYVLAVVLILAACETPGQSAGLGALIGGATGAIIGNQSGHAAEGALIGAAVGAAAGWVAGKVVKARRERMAQGAAETASEYNYKPEQGFRLEMKSGNVAPGTVKRGQTVTTTYQYATLGTGDGVLVEEACLLKKGTKVLTELDKKKATRTDGTWENLIEFQVPTSAEPGEYLITQYVTAKGKEIQRDVGFDVTPQTAQAPKTGERVLMSFVVE